MIEGLKEIHSRLHNLERQLNPYDEFWRGKIEGYRSAKEMLEDMFPKLKRIAKLVRRVESESPESTEVYTVVRHVADPAADPPLTTWVCSCPDFLIRKFPKGEPCKHIRRVMLEEEGVYSNDA